MNAADAVPLTSAPAPLIYQRMVAILRDTEAIGKDQRNDQQGFKFRGIDQVYNDLHGVFAKHGVFIRPNVVSREYMETATKSGNRMNHHFLVIDFHFCAEDGSEVVMRSIGEAADSGDKGTPKCMSIALKYALFQALLIPTLDDKDPDASGYERGSKAAAQKVGAEKLAALKGEPPPQTATQQETKPPAGKKSTDYKMLAAFGEMKKHIGDLAYYECIAPYEHANDITDVKEAKRIYEKLKARKMAIDAARDEEEANR